MDHGNQKRGSGFPVQHLIKSKQIIARPEREIAAGQGVRNPRIIQWAIVELKRVARASPREMREPDDKIVGIVEMWQQDGPGDSADSTRCDIDQGQSERADGSCCCWEYSFGYRANFAETVDVE